MNNIASKCATTATRVMFENEFAFLLPLVLFALVLVLSQASPCHAQGPASQAARALPDEAKTADTGNSNNSTSAESRQRVEPRAPAEIIRELELMRARIDELERELQASEASPPLATVQPNAIEASSTVAQESPAASKTKPSTAPEKTPPSEPFAYADWTWLNGSPRTKHLVWDSKVFTPEIRLDAHYIADFNHPRDDTIGGSTEIFRSMNSRSSRSASVAAYIGKM